MPPPNGRRYLFDLNALPVDDVDEWDDPASPAPNPPPQGPEMDVDGDGDDGELEEDPEEYPEEDREEMELFDGDGEAVREAESARSESRTTERGRMRGKQSDYEVFVGGLGSDAVEKDLKRAFRKVGDVVEVRLVRKSVSRWSKSFAFVRFATAEQASSALRLKVAEIRGKLCGVTRRMDRETLFVRNICTNWTKDVLVEKLKAHDLHNLEEVHLLEDRHCKGRNRGYAFFDFSTHMDAVDAYNKLQRRNVYLGVDVRVQVTFATTSPAGKSMEKVKSVFLDCLPVTWDEARVFEIFKKYGDIESVKLACNMPNAKRPDFGFITFSTRDAALACIDDVNKVGVVDRSKKVSVKATLQRPFQKRFPNQISGGWKARHAHESEERVEIRQHTHGGCYYDNSRKKYYSIGKGYENRDHTHSTSASRRVRFRSFSPTREEYTREKASSGLPGTRYRGTYYEDSYYERREASYGSDHEPSYELRAAGDYPSGMGLKRQVVVDSKFHHKDTVQISRSTIDSFDELYSDAEYTSGRGVSRHTSTQYRKRSRRGDLRSFHN